MKVKQLKPKSDFSEKNRKELKEISDAFQEFNLDLLKKINKAEEDCVSEVLETFLNRKPSEEDFKKCIKILINEDDRFVYALAYQSTILGIVKTIFDSNLKEGSISFNVNVSFDPDNFKINEDNTISLIVLP